jgi:hypothetical protein
MRSMAPRLHSSLGPRTAARTRCAHLVAPVLEERMAQIRVEQKRSGLGWLWAIIALLAAAALVWFLVASGRTTIGSEGSTPGDTLRTGDTTRTSRVAPAERSGALLAIVGAYRAA